jgi:peptide-methionine (R)-S-oxide reductase
MKPLPLIAAALVVSAALGGIAYFAQPGGAAAGASSLEALRTYVMDMNGTERAFDNEYWDHHEPGIYVEARTGEPLFASTDKFDSGSGWPSFTRPIDISAVAARTDSTAGMTRTEIRSAQGDAHLGHVFNDGPRERGGQRYCINSCAIRFIPRAEMEAAGYGAYVHLIDNPQPAPPAS